MAETRKTYPAEFKRRRVELVRAGRSPEELAKEFEPSPNTIRKWANQADIRPRPLGGGADDGGARGAPPAPSEGEAARDGA